jgi:hypothetical protein
MPDESYVPDPAEYRYGGRQQATMGSIAEMISGGEEVVELEPAAEPAAEAAETAEPADPASPGGA